MGTAQKGQRRGGVAYTVLTSSWRVHHEENSRASSLVMRPHSFSMWPTMCTRRPSPRAGGPGREASLFLSHSSSTLALSPCNAILALTTINPFAPSSSQFLHAPAPLHLLSTTVQAQKPVHHEVTLERVQGYHVASRQSHRQGDASPRWVQLRTQELCALKLFAGGSEHPAHIPFKDTTLQHVHKHC